MLFTVCVPVRSMSSMKYASACWDLHVFWEINKIHTVSCIYIFLFHRVWLWNGSFYFILFSALGICRYWCWWLHFCHKWAWEKPTVIPVIQGHFRSVLILWWILAFPETQDKSCGSGKDKRQMEGLSRAVFPASSVPVSCSLLPSERSIQNTGTLRLWEHAG